VEIPAIQVSSYRGSTLEIGERSGLIIGPNGVSELPVNEALMNAVALDYLLLTNNHMTIGL